MIKLSVIIPAFNAEAYISRCLNSILVQEVDESCLEVLIINDGSKDKTEEIVLEYTQKYSNFFLYNKENEGVSCARNMGVNLAKGEYILFVDADDELYQGALRLIYDFLSRNDVDMVVTNQVDLCNSREFRRKKPSIQERVIYSGIDAFEKGYLRYNAGGSICSRKFILDNGLQFPPHIKNGEDTIFFGLCQQFAQSYVYLDIDFYKIHLENNSASRQSEINKTRNLIDTVNCLQQIRNEIKNKNPQKTFCVIERITYLLLSNLTYSAVKCNYGLKNVSKSVCLNQLLPIKINACAKKTNYIQLLILNISYKLFYFLVYIKHGKAIG